MVTESLGVGTLTAITGCQASPWRPMPRHQHRGEEEVAITRGAIVRWRLENPLVLRGRTFDWATEPVTLIHAATCWTVLMCAFIAVTVLRDARAGARQQAAGEDVELSR